MKVYDSPNDLYFCSPCPSFSYIMAIHSNFHKDSPIQVYNYEHGDGVGSALDLILQGFIHAITMAAFPVVVCAGVLYRNLGNFHC